MMKDGIVFTHDESLADEQTASNSSELQSGELEPQFGLIDVIEAFTAMRHEFRGQTVENRTLSNALKRTAADLSQIEQKLISVVEDTGDKVEQASLRLVETICEIDLNLRRAVDAAARSGQFEAVAGQSNAKFDELKERISNAFNRLDKFRRWSATGFYQQVLNEISKLTLPNTQNETLKGFHMVVARVERLMADHEIERVETDNQCFDGERMNAIELVDSTDRPSGYVVEQISPSYVWQGRLVRYAEVRVAK